MGKVLFRYILAKFATKKTPNPKQPPPPRKTKQKQTNKQKKKKEKKKNYTANQQINKNLRKSPDYLLSDFQVFQMEVRYVNLDNSFCLSSYGLDDISVFELFIQLCNNTCKNFSGSNLTYTKERSFLKIRGKTKDFFITKSVLQISS